jgi:hypothetical protein
MLRHTFIFDLATASSTQFLLVLGRKPFKLSCHNSKGLFTIGFVIEQMHTEMARFEQKTSYDFDEYGLDSEFLYIMCD